MKEFVSDTSHYPPENIATLWPAEKDRKKKYIKKYTRAVCFHDCQTQFHKFIAIRSSNLFPC